VALAAFGGLRVFMLRWELSGVQSPALSLAAAVESALQAAGALQQQRRQQQQQQEQQQEAAIRNTGLHSGTKSDGTFCFPAMNIQLRKKLNRKSPLVWKLSQDPLQISSAVNCMQCVLRWPHALRLCHTCSASCALVACALACNEHAFNNQQDCKLTGRQ
jgi:hypothetical protein